MYPYSIYTHASSTLTTDFAPLRRFSSTRFSRRTRSSNRRCVNHAKRVACRARRARARRGGGARPPHTRGMSDSQAARHTHAWGVSPRGSNAERITVACWNRSRWHAREWSRICCCLQYEADPATASLCTENNTNHKCAGISSVQQPAVAYY